MSIDHSTAPTWREIVRAEHRALTTKERIKYPGTSQEATIAQIRGWDIIVHRSGLTVTPTEGGHEYDWAIDVPLWY